MVKCIFDNVVDFSSIQRKIRSNFRKTFLMNKNKTTLPNKVEWLNSIFNDVFTDYKNRFVRLADIQTLISTTKNLFNVELENKGDGEYFIFIDKIFNNREDEQDYDTFLNNINKGLKVFNSVFNSEDDTFKPELLNLGGEQKLQFNAYLSLIKRYLPDFDLDKKIIDETDSGVQQEPVVVINNKVEDLINFQDFYTKMILNQNLKLVYDKYSLFNYLSSLVVDSVFKLNSENPVDFNLTIINELLNSAESLTEDELNKLKNSKVLTSDVQSLLEKYYRFLLKDYFNLISEAHPLIRNLIVMIKDENNNKKLVFADVAKAITGTERYDEDKALDAVDYMPSIVKLFLSTLKTVRNGETVFANLNQTLTELINAKEYVLNNSESMGFDDLVESYFKYYEKTKNTSKQLFDKIFDANNINSIMFKYNNISEFDENGELSQSKIQEKKRLKDIMVTIIHYIHTNMSVSYTFFDANNQKVLIKGKDSSTSDKFDDIKIAIQNKNSDMFTEFPELQKQFNDLLNVKGLKEEIQQDSFTPKNFDLINSFAKKYESALGEPPKLQIFNKDGNALSFSIINNALGNVKRHLKEFKGNMISKNNIFINNPHLTDNWYIINQIFKGEKVKDVGSQNYVETMTVAIDYMFTNFLLNDNKMSFFYFVPSDSNTIYTTPISIDKKLVGKNKELDFTKSESLDSRIKDTLDFYRTQTLDSIEQRILQNASLYNSFFDANKDLPFKRFGLNVKENVEIFKENEKIFKDLLDKKSMLKLLSSFQDVNGLAFEKQYDLQNPFGLNLYLLEDYEIFSNEELFKQNLDENFDEFLKNNEREGYVKNNRLPIALRSKMNIQNISDGIKDLNKSYKYFFILDLLFRDSFDSLFTGGLYVHNSRKGNSITSFADMTKRAKVNSANKLPLIPTKEGLDNESNTILLKDEEYSFFTILGDEKAQEYLDGASEMLFLYGILTQNSMGGEFGVQAGHIQKTLNIAYDKARLIPIMEKHAIYPITNERMLSSQKYRRMNEKYMGQLKFDNELKSKLKNMKLSNPITFTVPFSNVEMIDVYKKLYGEGQTSQFGVTYTVETLNVENVNSVYDLFVRLGAYYAPDNASHYALADYIAVYPILKSYLILKQNYSTGRKMGNSLQQLVGEVENKDVKVKFQKIGETNNGVQLSPEHNSDNSKTTFVSQIFSASITESVNVNEYSEIMKALAFLSQEETLEFTNELNILLNDKISSDIKQETLKSFNKQLMDTLSEAIGSRPSDQSAFMSKLNQIGGMLSLDLNQFANLISTTFASILTKRTIRHKFLGGQNVMTPTFGRIEFYDIPFDYNTNTLLNGEDASKVISEGLTAYNSKTVSFRVYEQWKSNSENNSIVLQSRDLKWNNPTDRQGNSLFEVTYINGKKDIDESKSNPIYMMMRYLFAFKNAETKEEKDELLSKIDNVYLNIFNMDYYSSNDTDKKTNAMLDVFSKVYNRFKENSDNEQNLKDFNTISRELLKHELSRKDKDGNNIYTVPPVEITLPKVYESTFDLRKGYELFQYNSDYFFLIQLLKNNKLDANDRNIANVALEDLKSIKYKNDTISNIEKLKSKYPKIYNKGQVIKQAFDKSLEGVLARIPAQGMHSYFSFKVVEFTEELVNAVGYPVEVMYMQGADMDIDKGNVMGFDFVIESSNDIDRNINLWSDTSYILPFANDNLSQKLIDDKLDKIKDEKMKSEFKIALLKNHIVQQLISSARNPSAIPALNTPISFDELKEIANRIESKKNNKKPNKRAYIGLNSLIKQLVQNRVGKKGVGVGANYLKIFTAITASNNFELQSVKKIIYALVKRFNSTFSKTFFKITKKEFIFNGKTYKTVANLNLDYLFYTAKESNLQGDDFINFLEQELTKPQAWYSISGGTSAATDNAKDPVLGKLGLTLENSGMFYTMLSYGIPIKEAVDFLQNPVIQILTKTVDKSKNIFSDLESTASLNRMIKLFSIVPKINKLKIDSDIFNYFKNVDDENSKLLREALLNPTEENKQKVTELIYKIEQNINFEKQQARKKINQDEDYEYEQEQEVEEYYDEDEYNRNKVKTWVVEKKNEETLKLAKNYLLYLHDLLNQNVLKYNINNKKEYDLVINNAYVETFEQFKNLFAIAEENDYLARIFKINQGLPNSVVDITNFLRNAEKFIIDKIGNFNFLRFISDENYRISMIEQYDKVKSGVNVLYVIAANEQYLNAYLKSGYLTLYNIEKTMKVKMSLIESYYYALINSFNFNEKTIRNISQFIDSLIVNEYFQLSTTEYVSRMKEIERKNNESDFDYLLKAKKVFVDELEKNYVKRLKNLTPANNDNRVEFDRAKQILLKQLQLSNKFKDIISGENTTILHYGDVMKRGKNEAGSTINEEIRVALDILYKDANSKNFIEDLWVYTLITNKGGNGKFSMAFLLPIELKLDYNNFLIRMLNNQYTNEEDILNANNVIVSEHTAKLSGLLFDDTDRGTNNSYFIKYIAGNKTFFYRDNDGNTYQLYSNADYKYAAPMYIRGKNPIIYNWFKSSELEIDTTLKNKIENYVSEIQFEDCI